MKKNVEAQGPHGKTGLFGIIEEKRENRIGNNLKK